MVIYMLFSSFTPTIKFHLGDNRLIETFFINLVKIIICLVL